MPKYDWHHLRPTDLDNFSALRKQIHQAIQNVSLVGRQYLPPSDEDSNATLTWVPGLWRIVGKWIPAKTKFRSSLSLENFNIYLVKDMGGCRSTERTSETTVCVSQ